MFIAENYYLFLIAGVILVGYCVWRQIRRMKDVCGCGHDHMKGHENDTLHKHFLGHLQNRHAVRATLFKGFFLQIMTGFLGMLSLMIGLIGLILNVTK